MDTKKGEEVDLWKGPRAGNGRRGAGSAHAGPRVDARATLLPMIGVADAAWPA